MKSILFVVISFGVCFNKHFIPMSKVGVCLVAGFCIPMSAYPSFYEMGEEVADLESTEFKEKEPAKSMLEETSTEEDMKLKDMSREKCVEETHILPKKIITYMSGVGWEKEGDIDFQDWLLCVLVKMGLMSGEGVFKMDVAMSKISSKDADEVELLINECLPTKAMPARQIAWDYVKCLHIGNWSYTAISVF